MASIAVIAQPTTELISLQEAKTYLVVSDSYNDNLIQSMISSCRQEVEQLTGCAIGIHTIEYRNRASYTNKYSLHLPIHPIISLTSVEAFDGGSYSLLSASEYIHVQPSTLYLPSSRYYKVTYQAGYDSSTLPPMLKQRMLELLAFRYQNREGGPLPTSLLQSLQGMRVRPW